MKKLIVLLLVFVMVFSGCGSSSAGPKTIEEFIEKYKRADWSEFKTVVGTMMDEFTSVFSQSKGNWSQNKDAYNPDEGENGFTAAKAETFL